MRLRLLILAFAVVSLSAVSTPASVVAGSGAALPDCAGKPIIKPSNVVLTCADAGATASQIVWTGWGNTFTAGVGIASVNDCIPNCAAGHYHKYRIVLIADGQERCPNGQIAYARVTYAWIGRSPYPQDAPGTVDPLVRYPCAPRS